jgi:hypothetical protein
VIKRFPASKFSFAGPVDVQVAGSGFLAKGILPNDIIKIVPAWTYNGEGLWLLDGSSELILSFDPTREPLRRLVGKAVSLLRRL